MPKVVLPDRPLEPMLSEMKAHGVTFSQDKPPFTMTGRLQGGNFSMVGDVKQPILLWIIVGSPSNRPIYYHGYYPTTI